jgi:energy-coupling factor transport system substrate-specific component
VTRKAFSNIMTTRELVTLFILSSLGGALSTFVGYLGNLINIAVGVPFGAGQIIAGLHVFWIVLIRVLVPKRGSGAFAGLLKGFVEMFTGSTHGIVIVIVSLIQGVILDIPSISPNGPSSKSVIERLNWWLFAGLSSSSNVIVFQLFYFTGTPLIYISLITILAFCSGIIFAGYFAWQTLAFLEEAGLTNHLPAEEGVSRSIMIRRNLPAIAFVTFLILGSTYYAVAIADVFADPYSCEVTGLVETPYVYRPADFSEYEVTIVAELQGAYTHIPPTNYTGVLLSTILGVAEPKPQASSIQVIARDGYSITFDLQTVLDDERLLLTKSNDGLWLIAGNYEGSAWVKQVTELYVY